MKYPRFRISWNFFQQLIDRLERLVQYQSEPQVSQHVDRQGNLYYQVYDAMMAKSMTFGSEMEMKWWLEQRYRN